MMITDRRKTRQVTAGNRKIGGDAPILIQSMTNTDTRDVQSTLAQIERLAAAGCGLVRCAVPDMKAAEALLEIRKNSPVPLSADIHFDYKLALAAVDAGIDKLRINPGNIGSDDKVREVARAAKDAGIPIRIGVNAGSLEKSLLEKYGHPTAEAMTESALRQAELLESFGFSDIVVSMKASDVGLTVQAARLFASQTDYPLHLGVTEAGLPRSSAVKSAMGIGTLLLDGIGDTIRVSVTGDPSEEVPLAKEILRAAGRSDGMPSVELVSCPTCGRTQIDLIGIAEEVDRRIRETKPKKDMTVAVMGCIVNGPGEGREADLGVAGGNGRGVLFKKGEIFRTVPEAEIADALLEEYERMQEEKA